MSSITDYLYRLQELTNKNLHILSAIQDSFTTKKENISVQIGDSSYVIPSFISLENKINSLQNSFDNLIEIPKTGEASLTMDGNTQRIKLAGYSVAPTKLDLENITNFYINNNDIFKDFMTPVPYIHLGLPAIENNCKNVNVKKIVIKNKELSGFINDMEDVIFDGYDGDEEVYKKTGKLDYKITKALLSAYQEDADYIEYDTIYRLPLKTPQAYGEYNIIKIVNWYLDSQFEEHYTVQVDKDLTYIQNDIISKNIEVGDYLLTEDGRNKLVVEEIHTAVKELKLKVINGTYTNLHDITSGDKYKLKYYKSSDLDEFKYVNIPLEEDKDICIFIAPINEELNISAIYGKGLHIDTYNLTVDIDGSILQFNDYYKNYVSNVGDSLYSISSMYDSYLQNISKSDFDMYTTYKPIVNTNNIVVTQINKHLNDSSSIQNIRKLYTQKVNLKTELTKVNNNIDTLNNTLKKLSLTDTNREQYQNQILQLTKQKTSIYNNITVNVNDISTSANDAEVPIENAKYHIRGFIDSSINTLPKVIKLDVEYRYKNKNKFTGNAMTIGDNFIYSDWNKMSSFVSLKQPNIENFTYLYKYPENTENINEPSFNQIDIPITQGELVDIRVRYVYSLGYPFIQTTSAWSNIFTIEFPNEYLKNIEILDIIKENNNDVLKYEFMGILDEYGVNSHVNDNIIEQDMVYFHKSTNIASGFYTDERKIIPLFDKINSLNTAILQLQTEVLGAKSENLSVSISDGNSQLKLLPYNINTFQVKPFSSYDINNLHGIQEGNNIVKCAYSQLNIILYNSGKYNLNLYSIFPGASNVNLETTYSGIFAIGNYCSSNNNIFIDTLTNNGLSYQQKLNQLLYFRITSNYNNTPLYSNTAKIISANQNELLIGNNMIIPTEVNITSTTPLSSANLYAASLYPYAPNISILSIQDGKNFYTLGPGESLTIPMSFYYGFNGFATTPPEQIIREFQFDIRTSLYQDPQTYACKVIASYNNTAYNTININPGNIIM